MLSTLKTAKRVTVLLKIHTPFVEPLPSKTAVAVQMTANLLSVSNVLVEKSQTHVLRYVYLKTQMDMR